MSYSLIKDHTTVNYTKGNTGRKYIVIHYTGNNNDTARANANYFRSTYRGASAHYFVDSSTVYEVVDPANTAWAVGRNFGSGNLFGKCTNGNSISIEMCSILGKIGAGTYDNTIALTKTLMERYGIPQANVVRHWDVCTKRCPGWDGWLPGDESIWKKFKAALVVEEKQELPLPKIRGDLEEMQCTYTIDGGSTVYWFDGQRIHKLTHPDQLKVIRDIYKANTGNDMPSFKWKSGAPYYMRLEQAISLPAK